MMAVGPLRGAWGERRPWQPQPRGHALPDRAQLHQPLQAGHPAARAQRLVLVRPVSGALAGHAASGRDPRGACAGGGGTALTLADAQAVVDAFDVDKDGQLNVEEFIAMLTGRAHAKHMQDLYS